MEPVEGTALITGVTGFVGRVLARRMSQDGWRVRGSAREVGPGGSCFQGVELIGTGPLGPDTNWSRAVRGASVVIHLAARVHRRNESGAESERAYRLENTEGSHGLAIAAARAGVQRLVFCSTVKVCGDERERPYTETDPPSPTDAYGVSKWDAERALRQVEAETGMRVFVVRPPLVYGPGVRANFLSLLKLVDRGLPLPFASVTNRRSLVAVENLADVLALCASTSEPGGTFLVSDGDDVSTPELMRRMGAALDRPARLFRFPPALLRKALEVGGLGGVAARVLGTLRVDSAATRMRLGWSPRVSMAEELMRLVRWYRETGGRSIG